MLIVHEELRSQDQSFGFEVSYAEHHAESNYHGDGARPRSITVSRSEITRLLRYLALQLPGSIMSHYLSMRRTSLLGFPIDQCTPVELETFIRHACTSDHAHRIVTINPEIIVAAQRNPRYAATVRTADLVTIDGVGITIALRLCGRRHAERVTGTTILETACGVAAAEEGRVVFLLRNDGLSSPPLLHAALRERWPSLNAAIVVVDPDISLDDALARAIADHGPRILIANFGHPAQEQWIASYVDRFPSVRVAVGIGGAIDYLTGAVPIPPPLVRKLGMEWFWRLTRQPWRLPRIVDAVFRFPLLLVTRRA